MANSITLVLARYRLESRRTPELAISLQIGDRLRQALMSVSRPPGGHALPVFSGKSASGEPLADNANTYFLAADDNDDGLLDCALVFNPAGFDASAQAALGSVSRVWDATGLDVQLKLEMLASRDAYCEAVARRRIRMLPQLGPARVWESRTPMILSRHPKVRGGQLRDTPADQLQRELALLGYPSVAALSEVDGTVAGEWITWARFHREREHGGGSRAGDRGYGFRVTFSEPVLGPIAVGYAARQGLGQFIAIE